MHLNFICIVIFLTQEKFSKFYNKNRQNFFIKYSVKPHVSNYHLKLLILLQLLQKYSDVEYLAHLYSVQI